MASITDASNINTLAIQRWIASVPKHNPAPNTIPLLQMAFAAQHPNGGTLPDCAWPDFQVCIHHHTRQTGSNFRFNQDTSTFNKMTWKNTQATRNINRMPYPAAGPLGRPLIVHPPPIL